MMQFILIVFLIALIYFMIQLVRSKTDTQQSTSLQEKAEENMSEDDKKKAEEWEIVKKYVPEVSQALTYVLSKLDNEGISIAEKKLRDLFLVVGKEGLVENSLDIVVSDTLSEVEVMKQQAQKEAEQKSALEKAVNTSEFEKLIDNTLIAKLKSDKNVGFSPKASSCEICKTSNTKQLISNHFICAPCKDKYL